MRPLIATVLLSLVPSLSAGQPVTFAKHVAPIFFEHCVQCHHPGGAGPFSLTTYESARRQATQIAAVTASGLMPPWKADSDFGAFVGQKPLTSEQIDTIQRWVSGGAIEGDARDLPSAPRIAKGWQLGTPDLIVSPETYSLPAAGTDVFRIFVVPLPVDRVRFVRGVEFRPGNPTVVHHANIRVDRTPASRRFDATDAAPGYEGLIAHSAVYPDGHFLGWTPGQVAPFLPEGLAWTLNPGTDLVVEVHMQPSGKTEAVAPSIGLFFADAPPEHTPVMIRLGRQSIDIPAGEAHYTIGDEFVLPVDVELHAMQPHAHQRARQLTSTATLPDGTTRTLLDIDKWDFRWQHVYRLVAPVMLPKGTRLAMAYTYDNSAANPRNPVRPPRRVYWGQRSADEMGDVWIQVVPKNTRDLDTLVSVLRPKVLAEDAIGYERMIESEPESAALHDDAASVYLQLGRPADAVKHYEASLRLQPGAPAAHFNLGTALAVANRLDEATAQYRRALELNPDYALAHNNLGSILLRREGPAAGLPHLREALRLDPANLEAHFNLAVALAAQGKREEAASVLTRALALNPPEPMATTLKKQLSALSVR
jgi:Flp pilus assembly protein TadD